MRGHLYSSLLENLRPYTQYKARIRAANDLGTGDPSNVIVVSTKMKIPVERNINRKRDTFFSTSSFLEGRMQLLSQLLPFQLLLKVHVKNGSHVR